MKSDDFNKLVEVTFEVCKSTLCVKAKEYATEDRLHNFRRAAALLGKTPETALMGMLTKHIISVYDLVDRTEAGEFIPYELWNEKIIDTINYMVLLRAITHDKK